MDRNRVELPRRICEGGEQGGSLFAATAAAAAAAATSCRAARAAARVLAARPSPPSAAAAAAVARARSPIPQRRENGGPREAEEAQGGPAEGGDLGGPPHVAPADGGARPLRSHLHVHVAPVLDVDAAKCGGGGGGGGSSGGGGGGGGGRRWPPREGAVEESSEGLEKGPHDSSGERTRRGVLQWMWKTLYSSSLPGSSESRYDTVRAFPGFCGCFITPFPKYEKTN